MRIRTDGDYAYRKDVIERAADYYGCNKRKAVTQACEDLTAEQRREIAETLSTRAVTFETETTVAMETD